MTNTAGSPTYPMEISAAVTSHINWVPLLPSPALQALSWNRARGQLSVSIPAIPTGMTANLYAKVHFRIEFWFISTLIPAVYEIKLSLFFLVSRSTSFCNYTYTLSATISYFYNVFAWREKVSSLKIKLYCLEKASRYCSMKATDTLTVSSAALLACCES